MYVRISIVRRSLFVEKVQKRDEQVSSPRIRNG